MGFKNNTLGQVWDACSPFIEGYFGRLDSINADIKELEDRLNAARFHESLWVPLSEGKFVYGDESEGDFDVMRDFEVLVWCRTGERWRILHRRLREHGYQVHADPGELWFSVEILETRPLLETGKDVRIRVKEALERIIEQAAIRRAPTEEEVRRAVFIKVESEIPF